MQNKGIQGGCLADMKESYDKLQTKFLTCGRKKKLQKEITFFSQLFVKILFHYMFKPHLQNRQNVVICKGIQYILSVAAIFDQMHLL